VRKLKIEDIESIKKEFLIPEDIASFLGCDKYSINVQAQKNPDKLGFPVVILGSRIRIPKEGFVFWYKYGKSTVLNRNTT